jgi:chemotaxis signal transduction protein
MEKSAPNILLLFRCRERLLAVPLDNVQEVVPAFELLHTPGLISSLAGMISLRGEVLPVIDTAVLIGEDATVLKTRHKFIIARTSQQSIAFLVDTLEDIVDISDNASIEQGSCVGQGYFKGIVSVEEEMVLVLDVEVCYVPHDNAPLMDSTGVIHLLEGQIS